MLSSYKLTLSENALRQTVHTGIYDLIDYVPLHLLTKTHLQLQSTIDQDKGTQLLRTRLNTAVSSPDSFRKFNLSQTPSVKPNLIMSLYKWNHKIPTKQKFNECPGIIGVPKTDASTAIAAHRPLSYAMRSNDDFDWTIYSLMLSFQDLLDLPFLLWLPSTVPCSIFGSISWWQTWSNHDSLQWWQ